LTPLPVDELLPEIVRSLNSAPNLVLEAPPGAGKTTRVPPVLLRAGFASILVLEPRRLAARMAARRVAAEMGEEVGETVGYQVRFEQAAGPRTRLRFVTEGVLTRRLLRDPKLSGVAAVILDEFHERHLEGDLALALLRHLQRTVRPDLRLLVMSATLHGASISDFLAPCGQLRSHGRLFNIALEYTPHSAEPLETRVAQAAASIASRQAEGDILVFLPGAAEIRRAHRACETIAQSRGWMVLPLHGELSVAEQDRAVLPSPQRKLILSTNVAESSITIDGVRAVIDSGLARVAKDSAWSGLSRIEVSRVSRASAIQRAGRAGRTAPGCAIRLYPEDDFLRRPEYETPEILRRELSQVLLDLHAAGIRYLHELEWLEPPPADALRAAEELLRRLAALDAGGAITDLGRSMASLPLHPRMAALALHGGAEGCAAAAALSAGERLPDVIPHPCDSDVFLLLERRPEARTRQMEEQLLRLVKPPRNARRDDDALRQAILRAFPDRVARRRKSGDLQLAGGISAAPARNALAFKHDLLVAVEIEERPDSGPPLVRIGSSIEPEWLLDLFPERVSESRTVEWNRTAERVEASSALLYDGLLIEESRDSQPDLAQAAELLASKALEAGLERFADADALETLRNRAAFARQFAALPELPWEEALRGLCTGIRGFAELQRLTRDGGFERALLDTLGPTLRQALDRLAPEGIQLPSGRRAKVVYPPELTPHVASRLQDFFGMRESPLVGGGEVPLVVQLLAPNQRPVQTTQDLAGFWERLYPQVRRELSRRYPRHHWPENPYTALKD
jgi:ATP-dependent helicase HrpB